MSSKQLLVLAAVLVASCLRVGADRYSYDEGVRIKRHLLSREIDPDALPTPPNGSLPFYVRAHFLMHDLVNVDSSSEIMRLTASIVLVWNDYNLRWTSNISQASWMLIAAKEVWYPQLLLSNSVGLQTYARPDPRFDDLLVYMNGTVILRMYYTFDINCDAQVFKFPRDTMVCKLSFVSSLVSSNVAITADESTQDDMLAYDNDDQEWFVTNITFKSDVENLRVLNGTYTFSMVNAEIHVIRSIGYYLVVVQLPIFMMSCLIILSSFISVADGERLGFITQLCLTYIVFLLLLDSILPKSNLPLLSVCVIVCFCLSVVNVIESVVIRELLVLSARQGGIGDETENCDSGKLKTKDGKRKGKRRPWILYAERLDKFMLSINVIVVILIIILNIGVVYS